jgi:hypothetical protein
MVMLLELTLFRLAQQLQEGSRSAVKNASTQVSYSE